MKVNEVRGWTASGMINALIDGFEYDVPDRPRNRHRRALADWESEGNSIPNYEGPPKVEVRAGASLTRTEFVLAAMSAGHLTAADAKQAARGEWPASLAALLLTLPDADIAEIRWAAATVINRDDPVTLAVGQGMGLTDSELDELFGIA